MLYDGTSVTQLTDNRHTDSRPQINDNRPRLPDGENTRARPVHWVYACRESSGSEGCQIPIYCGPLVPDNYPLGRSDISTRKSLTVGVGRPIIR